MEWREGLETVAAVVDKVGDGELVRAEPVWFGPGERPLFGWLTGPASGEARGAVVLCPPLGDEERMTYRTFRKVAESLAAHGFVSLRFAYDGTGDSAGLPTDPDRLGAWIAGVHAALDLVRQASPGWTALVGMRMGAVLASVAAVASEAPPDACVLWDPCLDGREFLRHQQALLVRLFDGRLPSPTGADTPGYWYDEATVAALEGCRLDLARLRDTVPATLVLTREDRATRRRLLARTPGLEDGSGVAWEVAAGQADLLDVPPLDAAVPWEALATVGTWLGSRAPEDRRPWHMPVGPDGVLVATGEGGRPVHERVVRLASVGMFGIVTEPVGGGSRPWVVFVNVATEHHIGPGRQWVELARRWAGAGLSCLRFDLTGVGDSPVHPGQRENVTYARQWLDDLPDAVRSVSPDDPSDVVLVGLCSGGYGALETALTLGARGVCTINAAVSSTSMHKESGLADSRRQAFMTLPMPLVRLARKHGRTAWWIWRTVRQVVVGWAPMAVVARGVRAGVDTFVVSGEDEVRPLREVAYWRWFGERRLRRTGRFTLTVVEDMDHSLLIRDGRERAAALLDAHVRERFAPPGA
ncbi:MAG: alpha/beta hydrolase [Actinomycetota bacterium]|jgi:alpha-beta hydrolase superfamily lysophospholipase|nr:alpha/beta hydrolase [Actinomycetota bacterium]